MCLRCWSGPDAFHSGYSESLWMSVATGSSSDVMACFSFSRQFQLDGHSGQLLEFTRDFFACSLPAWGCESNLARYSQPKLESEKHRPHCASQC